MLKQKKMCVFLCILFAAVWLPSMKAYANAPYRTFTEDHNGKYVRTQDAYYPSMLLDNAGTAAFNNPSDIYIDSRDHVYVADTGNKRIDVLSPDGKLLRTIGSKVLNEPTGVYVTGGGDIYAADHGNDKVYQFNPQGKLMQSFGKPKSPLFGKDNPFKPLKVTADKRGNIYIIGEGSTNGVIQLSPFGDFSGYFGSNSTPVNLKTIMEHTFFTKRQLEKLFSIVPNSPTNVTIDKKGLIYTITRGDHGASIKKLNISGLDMLPQSMIFDPLFTDITVGPIGDIYAISQTGFVYEYDSEGNLVFKFGGPDGGISRKGLLVKPSGIAVNSRGWIYVTESTKNDIQVFAPSDFTKNVHQALSYYEDGDYIKSQRPWNQVLHMNSLFDLAHKGLGEAYYKEQKYTAALKEYDIAGDKKGYSDAFWEIRNAWLQSHLVRIFLILLLVTVLYKLLKRLHKKHHILDRPVRIKNKIVSIPLINQLLFLFYFIRHPIDGYYGIQEEKKTSVLSATLLYIVFFIEQIFSLYHTSFIFNSVQPTDIMLSKECVLIFAPFALGVVSNFLVSTISEGEGRFRDVYQATIYSFVPYLVFSPLIVILSNATTYNESFVYHFLNTVMLGWTLILIGIMVKEIHDYTFGETLVNLLFTVFSMIILLLVLFIIYVLLGQVIDFISSVIQEVLVRATL